MSEADYSVLLQGRTFLDQPFRAFCRGDAFYRHLRSDIFQEADHRLVAASNLQHQAVGCEVRPSDDCKVAAVEVMTSEIGGEFQHYQMVSQEV